MQQSGWNYVSMGDGARLCADSMRDAAALRKSLKESEGGVSLEMRGAWVLGVGWWWGGECVGCDAAAAGDGQCRQLQADVAAMENRVSAFACDV